MSLTRVYECFCDETRLRILHLLGHTPLCVCHFQAILDEPQVKISKHLRYLKARGLVESRQHHNWRIYSLPQKPGPELERHLKCLQDSICEDRLYRADLRRLQRISPQARDIARQCCEPAAKRTRRLKALCC